MPWCRPWRRPSHARPGGSAARGEKEQYGDRGRDQHHPGASRESAGRIRRRRRDRRPSGWRRKAAPHRRAYCAGPQEAIAPCSPARSGERPGRVRWPRPGGWGRSPARSRRRSRAPRPPRWQKEPTGAPAPIDSAASRRQSRRPRSPASSPTTRRARSEIAGTAIAETPERPAVQARASGSPLFARIAEDRPTSPTNVILRTQFTRRQRCWQGSIPNDFGHRPPTFGKFLDFSRIGSSVRCSNLGDRAQRQDWLKHVQYRSWDGVAAA